MTKSEITLIWSPCWFQVRTKLSNGSVTCYDWHGVSRYGASEFPKPSGEQTDRAEPSFVVFEVSFRDGNSNPFISTRSVPHFDWIRVRGFFGDRIGFGGKKRKKRGDWIGGGSTYIQPNLPPHSLPRCFYYIYIICIFTPILIRVPDRMYCCIMQS